MPRKLLLINAILIAIAAGSVVFIVRQLLAPTPLPLPTQGRPAPTAGVVVPSEAERPAVAYPMVASKNLFSPTRTEAPVVPQAATAINAPRPNLFGVVLRDGAPIAYLEDPTSKRISGYRVGDAVAGGTVQAISADTVSINRPDGKMDVRLRDPGKPRSPATPPTAGVPGAQPAANLPGVIPPAVPPALIPTPAPVPVQPGVAQPQPGIPPTVGAGRRPLPPNLLRRLPQPQPTDVSQE